MYTEPLVSPKAATHPQRLPRTERRALFEKCSQKMSEATIRPWFIETESGRIMRDNAADWILWALFSTHEGEYTEEWEEEINEYLEMFAERLGRPLAQGRDENIKCMRLTLDPVVMCHRPFLWYMVCLALYLLHQRPKVECIHISRSLQEWTLSPLSG